uniref:Uncharacterized protein n=1 Tax=Chenopodium quinoa TaxID=63459 RepID=A0A803LZA6_CHEQI
MLTNLDIYVTKKPKRRHEDDGIFCSCGSSTGSNASCGRDCHCGMLLSTCSSNCKCGDDCVNKPFQQRPVKKLKLVQTEKCGAGIVAVEDIRQGEFVIEYVGEDQDCHCGADSCRRKLGVKPNKKMPSSDAALKLVARQEFVTAYKINVDSKDQRQCSFNCIGEVVRIPRPDRSRTFGIIKRFDNTTKKHLIMFADGSAEFIDMSKVDWEFCNFLL